MDNDLARSLVRQTLLGKSEPFAELVRGFQTPVYNLALRMTGSPSDAVDLTQEIFLRAWLNLDKYDSRQKFFTWLYTVALNLVRNHLKKVGRTAQPVPLFPALDPMTERDTFDPPTALAARQARLDMRHLLHRLPLEQREALLLRFYQDIAYEDMAAILGVTKSAAKMRVSRGLAVLRGILEKSEQQRENSCT